MRMHIRSDYRFEKDDNELGFEVVIKKTLKITSFYQAKIILRKK